MIQFSTWIAQMRQAHLRASDSTPVVMHLHEGHCTAKQTAIFLMNLGISLVEADLSGFGYLHDVKVADVPVLLMGSEAIDNLAAYQILCGQLANTALDDRLIVVVSDRDFSFEERRRLSELGNVKLIGPEDDGKRARDLIRDWMRDRAMSGYRVLLVEDSKTDAYLAKKYMQAVGIEVMHIMEAELVLSAIEDFQPDLIISDLRLPGCAGDQMTRIIRQDREVTMPIIFLSSEGNSDTQLMSIAAGADGFIRKPLREETFIKVIKSTIRRSVTVENRMRRDPLTNLLNRAQFDTSMRRVTGRGEQSALAIIDIDHFKRVNDTYGHPTGDQVICRLAKLLEDGVRSTDYVGRMGGEEFALLMTDCSASDAKAVLDRLRERFKELLFHSEVGDEFRCTFSCGLTELGNDSGAAYKIADEALYDSKRNGRNQVSIRGVGAIQAL